MLSSLDFPLQTSPPFKGHTILSLKHLCILDRLASAGNFDNRYSSKAFLLISSQVQSSRQAQLSRQVQLSGQVQLSRPGAVKPARCITSHVYVKQSRDQLHYSISCYTSGRPVAQQVQRCGTFLLWPFVLNKDRYANWVEFKYLSQWYCFDSMLNILLVTSADLNTYLCTIGSSCLCIATYY